METKNQRRLKETRLMLMLTFVLLVAAAYQFVVQANEIGVLFLSRRWTGLFILSVLGAMTVGGLFITTWARLWDSIAKTFEEGLKLLMWLKWGNLLLFLVLVSVYAWLVLGPLGYLFENYVVRLCLFWLVVSAGAVLFRAFLSSGVVWARDNADTSWFWMFVAAWIMAGFGYQIALFLPEISSHPFSLGWSETSRYYYASLFFSKEVYGVEATPTVLHPSRYLMQAIPYIVPGLPLWFHRFWQVLIWAVTALITVYLLSRRLSLSSQRIKVALALFMSWAYIFLFQGPVYYHLLVCVIIILWGFDRTRFWRSLLVVIAASAWAGISRLNWYPVPGLLAATLYFLETPYVDLSNEEGERSSLQLVVDYVRMPVAWVVLGILVAFGAQLLYVFWSGADPGEFTSSFTSDLLWYRLLPNPTFPVGILLAIILISAPLLVLIGKGLRGIHPLRLLGVWSILSVLFVGGVIVSTKIGGGSNLHNLDAYLVMLLVVGGYVYFQKVQRGAETGHLSLNVPRVLLFLIVLIPVAYALRLGGSISLPEKQVVEQALETLTEMTSAAVQEGGEVLLITERQLLIFGIVEGIPLVEEFETVFLMEMAMAHNQAYLSEFRENLQNERYAVIVTDQQRINYKGRAYAFGEENDVWVAEVTVPLLKYYQREVLFNELGIEVLVPKE